MDGPAELRATITDCTDSEEVERRREATSEWEHVTDRLSVGRAALAEYGRMIKHCTPVT